MSNALAGLPNVQLLERVRQLVARGNTVEADLIIHLGEVDARRLYLEEGCSSMFSYCQRVLHFAEGVAYKRIQAARAARRHPEIIDAVRSGDLHLTAVGLLAAKLSASNCADLIRSVRHRSADEVKRLLADLEPKATPAPSVRRIHTPSIPLAMEGRPQVGLPHECRAARAPVIPATPREARPEKGRTEPLGAERYRVQFTADRETHEQLEELRALMRHQFPDGDLGKILGRAISVLIAQVRKQKFAETSRPRPPQTSASRNEPCSRHIPAAVRRAVWQRDAGRCTYVSASGRRCDAREFVEFDHVDTWTETGAHPVERITLRCRAHNQLRARLDFGEKHMAQFRRSTGFESSSAPG